ncbi:hypothetical protein ACLOJK_000308 [Asimina triloba]
MAESKPVVEPRKGFPSFCSGWANYLASTSMGEVSRETFMRAIVKGERERKTISLTIEMMFSHRRRQMMTIQKGSSATVTAVASMIMCFDLAGRQLTEQAQRRGLGGRLAGGGLEMPPTTVSDKTRDVFFTR